MNDQGDISTVHAGSSTIAQPGATVIVHEHDEGSCPVCGGSLGIGLKEEPSCWKIYEICTTDGRRCVDRRAGTVAKGTVDHDDEVFERAAAMIG